jgi:flagellar M-ring protein FliF
MALIRQAAAVVAILLLAFFLLRPLLRGILHPRGRGIGLVPQPYPAPPQVENQPQVEAVVGGSAEKDPGAVEAANKAHYEKKIGVARRATNDDPRQVAQIVNNWVVADGT